MLPEMGLTAPEFGTWVGFYLATFLIISPVYVMSATIKELTS